MSVTFPAGGTIFIGSQYQFEAREMLSNGTTRVATGATWGTDATVSPTGLVTAIAAGETTIYADVNPRGQMRIRVFPDVGGTWTRTDAIVSCDDSGDFEGACDFLAQLGLIGVPGNPATATFTQNNASVDAVIRGADSEPETVTTTGTITIAGELQLQSAPILPADPDVNVQLRNWRSRADTPLRMTGTYELFLTDR